MVAQKKCYSCTISPIFEQGKRKNLQSRCRPGSWFGSFPLWHYKCFMNENKGSDEKENVFISFFFFCSFSLLVVQGQVEVYAVLQDTQSIQEKAEYYVLLKGSHIHHVTKAQRKEKCHLLSFIIPGRSCGPIINKQSPVKAHYIYSDLQNYWLLHENKQKVVYKKNNTCNK